eukprot:1087540-Rhodomonas_salina.1
MSRLNQVLFLAAVITQIKWEFGWAETRCCTAVVTAATHMATPQARIRPETAIQTRLALTPPSLGAA